jgi:hypothetical protein
MGHYASEMQGEPFTKCEQLFGAHVLFVARNFLLQCDKIGLPRAGAAINITAHRHWVTDEPSRTWVTIGFNQHGKRNYAPGRPLQGYVHTADWQEWQVASHLYSAWTALTSNNPPLWTRHYRANGQCAVSALVAQDVLGGDIVNCLATSPYGRPESHYANLLAGEMRDFTRIQFPPGTTFSAYAPKPKTFASTREYLLSDAGTKARYERLAHRYRKFAGVD